MGILSLLLITPAIGALILALVPGQDTKQIRLAANIFAALSFLLSCWLVVMYDIHDGALQFEEQFVLNPKLGTAFALGVDGLSLPMVVLATLLTSIALLASFSIKNSVKGYYISILMLEFGMVGVFLSQDWSLFYIFWELTLIPLFILIARWGGTRRNVASINFVLYTMGGSVFMLISLLAISQYMPPHGGTLMSAMTIAAQSMPRDEQVWVLLGFLIGFGVKMPIFPLHGWLPLAHVEAPSPVSILLSGILLKMGAYGMIRVIVMLPEATQILQTLLITLALIGMIYGGVLAWRQTDMKAMVAYSSVSHMGIILLDIATMNKTGLIGAVLQMTAHGLVAGAMFLLVGLLYERTHTRNILDYSSLVRVMPRFALFMTITLFAAMGLPGTVGFIAELHAIVGGFQEWGNLMILLGVSILIGTAYAMRTIGMLFTGPVKPQMRDIEDLKLYELIAAGVLVAAIVLFGLWPAPLIDLSMATVNIMNDTINQSIR
ncbi:MAG: NADH-quinone oxidoreductase subunit M [Nitrosomonas sp.]|uniref:complex I subunit 4 family protein n=1 Tax=Nitrosomonas sp. TaxID=42353 RepID=UPI002717F6F3|nr:NADH-quinone oxidoreductase subunit M [Nitrosomonas sp.]MDO8895691.1 NADH-quinone oxidoreductase subunit M [Nitrosomonas sp.]MDO9469159.1 NADH-quinone oxidoreductase subunit M [Nitrosomonas sp.]MDP1549880.1 NADH-quinone oxidoreductase subunit M [Nitrosomonas sp.]MDP1787912.1 NADH-quinone oxidoreductase subunit M [Nitrosomonas sp.]MDP3281436.1 NADH-quinone oxidoreductase subunit M [Nitrosomonas sp.]